MKNLNVIIALYIFGFVVFFTIMEILQVEKILFREKNNTTYNNNVDNNSNSDFLKYNTGHTVLKPEDSKKPLTQTKEELGRHTWALLHSIAASIPSIPTEEDKLAINSFLTSLAHIYPCKVCSKHFKEMLNDMPIKNKSREEFVYYICDLHNKVNVRLGKPIYDCKKTFDIWGGDCGCNVEE
jgi:hypothetical protein